LKRKERNKKTPEKIASKKKSGSRQEKGANEATPL